MSSNITEPVVSQDTASLVHRLAGPSTGKAGLSKDQTEINRIIADASKGSKFYYNEKRKDKDLTQRIDKILQLRDSTIRGVDLQSVEHSVDRLISELEFERDLSQTIVHVDMDAFYANVEMLDNPDLSGKPFGVGHGILCTASYEARKYGVRSGMPGFIAKKLCPELILVPLHFERYMELSKAVMSVLRRYDPTLFAVGCDEAYLNVTTYCKTHELSAANCVQGLREAVFEATRLTASAGIAPTKMLAKICSDKNKPNGQFELSFDPDSIRSFLRDLPIRQVPGVGRVYEQLLGSIGIKTCGDIFTYRAIIYLMDKQFGSLFLFRTYLGVTSNTVKPISREERKSIGAERTFSPSTNKKQILDKLNDIAFDLEKDMSENGWAARKVTLKFKMDTYQVFTRTKSFDRWVTRKEDLFATGKALLPKFPLTLRLIGLRVTRLKDLRATSDTENNIRRFFEPLKDSRPLEKIKTVSEHGECDIDSKDEVSDDAMPGFDTMDEDDHDPSFAIECQTTGSDSKDVDYAPDPSDPICQIHSVAPSEGLCLVPPRASERDAICPLPTKPHNVEGNGRLEKLDLAFDEQYSYECPVCGKALQTDNQGLNSHMDFCLSRSAIRQAHAEATSFDNISRPTLKPSSKGKGKNKK
ncbi:hypothetical protein C0992_000746 [Termitomyces sp. T32_za158]|nr:hypothetical protein C0992_000746 [Termitomyces sp. T32_za158]